MDDISRLPHGLNKQKRECQAIIETPKGRRSKFKYEPESKMFSLSHVLPQGFTFPFDFGFIPSTKAEDGDPLDIIVLMDEPAHVGCLLKVRIIGVIKVVQSEGRKKVRNDRLIGVSIQGFEYEDIRDAKQLKKSFLKQVNDFVALYNKDSDKQDEVEGIEGPLEAIRLLEKSIAASEHE